MNGFKILEKACSRYPYGWNVKRRRLAVLHFRVGQCFSSEGAYYQAMKNFLLAGFFDPVRTAKVLLGIEKGKV